MKTALLYAATYLIAFYFQQCLANLLHPPCPLLAPVPRQFLTRPPPSSSFFLP